MSTADHIPGGYILLARQMLESELMDKPPLWSKLWAWMLLRACFRDHPSGLKRGQFYTSIEEMREAMSHMVGYRRVMPSVKEIRRAYEGLAKGMMVGTTKGTRGMVVTILNYEKYQDPRNYEGHDEGHNERTTKGTIGAQDRKERKKEKKNVDSLRSSTFPASSPDAAHSEPAESESYLTRKKRKLTGKRLATFERFWKAFAYAKGKAEAADAWLDIPTLTDALVEKIVAAAEREAAARSAAMADGRTPKMAQGWISGKRWEDEAVEAASDPYDLSEIFGRAQ